MKKVLIILFLNTILCSSSFAESYYFNKCQLTNMLFADYLIDFDKNIIKVKLEAADGTIQEFLDPIELVEKDKIISKKIKSGKGEDYYFIYYLDVKSKSVIKQNYKKEKGLDIVRPDGPKKINYCDEVKANWHIDKIKITDDKKEKLDQLHKEKIAKEKQKRQEELRKLKKKKENAPKRKNRHSIKIEADKWIKISDYETATGAGKKIMDKLKNDFDLKAFELCAPTGNFDILKKRIVNLEIDETPAIGLEPKIKMGISGVVECK